MVRFYKQEVVVDSNEIVFRIAIETSDGREEKVEVTKDIYDEITELQREYWRQEKRESRHTWHLELISEYDLPQVQGGKGPEQLLIEAYDRAVIVEAVLQIPETQRRRFLLHYLNNLTLDEIAKCEGCSNRAISYSLTLARRNLRELLHSDFS